MSERKIRWIKVQHPGLADLGEARPLRVEVRGQALCLVRLNGRIHATLDRCPHQGSSFVGGWCEDNFLICPKHRMGFHLGTGEGRNGSDRLPVFPVEERADGVYVGMERPGFRLFGLRKG